MQKTPGNPGRSYQVIEINWFSFDLFIAFRYAYGSCILTLTANLNKLTFTFAAQRVKADKSCAMPDM